MTIVQIIGAFNTGTNLLTKLIKSVFQVEIHKEGHSLFWKHTVTSNNFNFNLKEICQQKDILYIIITKHPYWWLHSIYKRCYSLTTEKSKLEIGIEDYIKQPINVEFPVMDYVTDYSTNYFENFVDYYNKFHQGWLDKLPAEQTIYVKYIDLLNNPMSVVSRIMQRLTLKPHVNIVKTINTIFAQPAKKHGNPRKGLDAKKWYNCKNQSKLFTRSCYDWINTQLNEEIMKKLKYDITISHY